ncbi:MAG: hypothetical protein FH756_13225 [Firmicutes bacterium]|nr:hypothetical protein [Bacillota bacterium]
MGPALPNALKAAVLEYGKSGQPPKPWLKPTKRASGLDSLYYAPITEDENGVETYGTPKVLAKAISAELSVELIEAILYADDGASEVVKEFKSGALTLGIDDIGALVAQDLTGCKIDSNNVVVSRSEDGGNPVAIGFRAKKANGKYRYFWMYRVIFNMPATSLATKGDSITFSNPTIEGTVFRRNKLDGENKHPWKAEVTEGDTGVLANTISNWFSTVYEPDFTSVTPTITISTQPAATTNVVVGSITESLSVVASGNTSTPLTYQWYENTTASTEGGTPINGETSASFNIPTDLTAGTKYYYCVITLETVTETTTLATVVAEDPVITITTEPVDTTVAAGSITESLVVEAVVTGSKAINYQWYENTTASATGGTVISGATAATFAIPTDLTAGTYYYYCILSSSGASDVTTAVATVTVS